MKDLFKGKGKLFFVLAVTMVFTAGSAMTGFCEDVIRLGVAGPHSGDLASYGLPTVKAAELVVKEINSKGGVLGKKVKLLVEDDVCKPELATNTATKLVADKVDILRKEALGEIESKTA